MNETENKQLDLSVGVLSLYIYSLYIRLYNNYNSYFIFSLTPLK